MPKRMRTIAASRLAWGVAALALGLAACDDNVVVGAGDQAPAEQRAEAVRPPDMSPGAAPSADRLIGTWTVTQVQGGADDGRGEHAASTTYRFQDSGRVTVAGSRQCAYTFDGAELKVDCDGRLTAGTLEFRGEQSMRWSVGKDLVITLTKR